MPRSSLKRPIIIIDNHTKRRLRRGGSFWSKLKDFGKKVGSVGKKAVDYLQDKKIISKVADAFGQKQVADVARNIGFGKRRGGARLGFNGGARLGFNGGARLGFNGGRRRRVIQGGAAINEQAMLQSYLNSVGA